MSNLIAFYRGESANPEGRKIEDIWTWDRDRLEVIHNYIQWLFPLPQSSKYNSTAPILDDLIIQEFHSDQELRKRLFRSFKLLLDFYGLECVTSKELGVRINKASNFASRRKYWLRPMNHNHLRITRILSSLNLLGLRVYAKAFLTCLQEIYQEDPNAIADTTIQFWRNAVAV